MKKNKTESIPVFKTEEEERDFWAEHDSTAYLDWRNARRIVMPNLKPSMKKISLRIPETMLAELKLLANKKDVPYQSLLKIFLSDRIKEEQKSRTIGGQE